MVQCRRDFINREFAHTVIAVGIALHAGDGQIGQAGAGEFRLQDRVSFTHRFPNRRILRTEQRDDWHANSGRDVHGAAVVAKKEVERADQRGELSDGESLIDEHHMALSFLLNLLGVGEFAGTSDNEDLRVELILQIIADGGESFAGPDPKATPAAGVEEDFRPHPERVFFDDLQILLAWHETNLTAGYGNPDGLEQFQVSLGDVLAGIEVVGDLGAAGVNPAMSKWIGLAVVGHADGRAGESRDDRGLIGVVEIEHLRETDFSHPAPKL